MRLLRSVLCALYGAAEPEAMQELLACSAPSPTSTGSRCTAKRIAGQAELIVVAAERHTELAPDLRAIHQARDQLITLLDVGPSC